MTNRYGANVAQTGRTTDYRQDDEEWWQRARQDGAYVADIGYDKSAGAQSVDICVRVDDENGNFIGVVKAVFTIEGISALLRSRMSDWQLGVAQQSRPILRLLTADKKVIFPADSSCPVLADGSRFLEGHQSSCGRGVRTHHRYDEELGDVLVCYAFSRGHDEFKSLGWVLIVEHKAEDILAPVAALRRSIFLISIGVTVASLVLGIGFSVSLSRRIGRLKNAADRIGQGDLGVSLDVQGADEICQLGRCFGRMTRQLSQTLVSKSALEFEIAERRRIEAVLRQSEEQVRITLASIGDGVIATDIERRVTRLNAVAEELTGWTEAEARGKPLQEVFEIVNEQTRAPAEDPVARVLATGRIESLVNHTVVLARDGTERPIADSAAPIRDAAGRIVGAVLVFRDVSGSREAERQLQDRMQELERFNHLAVGREQRMIELKREVNEMARKAGAAPRYDLAFAECGTGGAGGEA